MSDTSVDTAADANVTDSEKAALDIIDNGGLSELRALYNPDLDFRKLALEAKRFSEGYRLVDKRELLGVPFIIIGVHYRQGFPLSKERPNEFGDFVSVEAIVADSGTLRAPQTKSQMKLQGNEELTVYPNEAVVFNDGGTGVRRELTRMFDKEGLIKVGGKGDDRYDRPFGFWDDGADLAVDGIKADKNGEAFTYLALRGLRKSDYEYNGQPARTYYFG